MSLALDKYARLKERFARARGAAVAFSGGADSTLLLKAAVDALGDAVLAITVRACAMARAELDEAERFCRERGVRHEFLDVDLMGVKGFAENPPDRCYHCKRAIFGAISALARERALPMVAEGSNADDGGDYRPGRRALAELGIASPLSEAGLTKAEVRECLREFGLAAWRRPSAACLASRVPYGERISPEALRRVEAGEALVKRHLPGAVQVRVRAHGALARVEVAPEGFEAVAAARAEIADGLRRIGFAYSALDLEGYRTGSLNEVL